MPTTRQTRCLLAALATLFLATPATAQTFTNETSFAGVGTTGDKDGGIAWADFNRDGCLDLFVNTDNSTERSRIYLSDCGAGTPGRPTFTDVTATTIAGFLATTDERSAVVGDLTGDGYLDLLRNDSDTTQIYFNNGPGAGFTFGDVNQNPNISYDSSADWPDNRDHNTEGAGFIDYDGDGDLDVILDNHDEGVVLLRNDGAGTLTFIDPTTVGLPFNNSGDGDYSTVADLDLDGDTDFIARKGTGATGLDVYTSMRVDLGTNTFAANPNFNQDESNSNKGSVAVCDFNNDLRPDLFWTDNGTNQIWRNDGQDANGHVQFTALGEPSASSGVSVSGIDHAACADVDNDGDLDLFLTDNGTDYLFINNGNFSFTRDNRGITGSSDGEGAAFADYDRDGDLDLIINQDGANELWRNTTNNENYMIIAPTLSRGGIETPAVGATIVVTDSNGVTVGVREISGGDGHGSSSAHDAHFGLPDPNERYTATIQYPNGATSQVCFTPSEQVGYHRAQVLDTAPSTCVAEVCGDGIETLDEKCDDGNTTDGDGCSSTCEIEAGWQCMERGSFSRLQADEDDLPSLSTDWYVDADATTIMERSDNHGFYPIAAEHRGQVYTVDVTPRDNDSFGVAFGYRPGEIGAASDVNFYLFTWCQVDCGDFGTGARLIRIDQPGMTAADYLAQAGFAGATQVATGTNFPNTGFVQGQTYRFEFGVNGSRVQLSIDGASEIDFDTGTTFDEGYALFSFDMNSSPFVNATAQTDTSLCYAPNCRDGNLDVGEQCDDGNDVSGDGCSSCLIDVGAACGNDPMSASTCVNIEVPSDGSTIMTEGTYSGSASPGESVTLTWRNTIGLVVATTTVTADANGNWSAPAQGLLDGEYDLTASVSTGIGTAEDTHTFTLNSGNTSVTLIEPADNSRTDDNTPTFSGTGEAGDTITIIVDGNNIGTTTVTLAGTWSFTPTTPIAEGNHTVSVEAENLFGNTAMDGPHAFEIDLDFDDDGLTNDEERALNTDINNPDTDGDGVRDDVEVGPDVNNPRDTDNDNTIDALDTDDDGDGILTEDEDLDGDGDPTNDNSDAATGDTLPNYLDNDDDNDGVLTRDEDIDGDGDARNDNTDAATGDILPDYLDTDDDGDSTLTINEPGDADNSGTPDRLEPCTPDADSLACPTGDPDGDGTPNNMDPDPTDPCVPNPNALACDTGDTDGDTITNGDERNITGTDPNNPDTDGDGLRDDFEVGPDLNNPINTDNDALIDALDPDDDGDGVSTLDEDLDGDGDPTNDNTDAATGDTTPDYLDTDDDGDGKLTEDEDLNNNTDYTDDDSDGDGIIEYLDPDDNDGPNGDADMDGISNINEDVDGDGDYTNDDTDNDTIPDYLDPDDDNDGVPTIEEDLDGVGDSRNDDSDGDMVPNYRDTDDDGDGVLTEDEDVNMDGDPTNDDSNMDNIPNFLDPCDPDDMATACSSGDTDNDGTPNDMDPDPTDPCIPNPNALACDTGDTDGDTITNGDERNITGTDPNNPDTDGDGLRDDFEVGPDLNNPINTDMDNLIDALDADDDGDGVDTANEDINGDGDPTNDNRDGDGLPNYLDPDDDNDGVLTRDEDIDGDGDPSNDFTDGDALPDYLDTDDDNDGILTEDEPGDTDNSGTPDRLEVCAPDPNVAACGSGDMDGDGTPNDMDPDPADPCVPDPNALTCDTGDTDGDTITNGDERIAGTDPTNPDTDGDGVRDDVEVGPDVNNPRDTDNDNTIDALDTDDDGDGILTEDEDLDGDGDPTNDDSDMDTIPDYLDEDDDNDGIDTIDEDLNMNGDSRDDDSDNDTIPDYLDPDDDNDGVLTIDEDRDGDGDARNDNTDGILGDTTPDYLDTDDDGDGVPTALEDLNMNGDFFDDDTNMDNVPNFLDPCDPDPLSQACANGDTDMDEVPNNMDPDPLDPCVPNPDALACPTGDTDMDGIPNQVERTIGTNPTLLDSDFDGIPDGVEVGNDVNNPIDTDMDMIIDALDPDDDGDGVNTADEDIDGDGDPTNDDTDMDTVPDYLDTDDDGDGVLTIDEDIDGDGDPTNDDTDMDMIPDYLDVDDDGDGVLTVDEDIDGDGDPTNDDTDLDMVPNYLDTDDDGDSIPTRDEDLDLNGDASDDDSDMDMVPNYLDPDDDNDGVLTRFEDVDGDGDPTNDNTDAATGDTLPNYLDVDDDGDGLLTEDENADPNGDGDPSDALDSDMDSTPDYLDPDNGMMGTLAITAPLDGDVTTRTPTFAGTTDPGAEVEVFVDGESVGTTTADDNGAWSLTVPDDESLAAGPHEVSATSDTGAMAGPVSFTVIDDMPSEVVDITSPENGATLTDATVTITGTATPNATVDVRVDGESIGTVMADENGDWSIEATLEDGPHSIEAKNGAASDLINVEVAIGSGGDDLAIDITSPAMADEVLSPTPTFAGTATAGASVEVFVDGESVGETTADENGDWAVTVADEDALAVGAHDVRAVATLDGDSQESSTIPFLVSEDGDDNEIDVLLIGGCSQTPGAPAPFDMAPWLAALGLLALGRTRRSRASK